MKYMGSKSRIAKYIVPIIQQCIDDNKLNIYCEPFAGGMNVIDKVKCELRVASDKNKYLVALFKHLQSGGKLLDEVPRELYTQVKNTYLNGEYEDWYIGNIEFLASYNGKGFNGGYGKPVYEKTKNGLKYRDYYQEAKRNIEKQIHNLTDVVFNVCDYKMCDCGTDTNPTMIYCDPPYQNKTKYVDGDSLNYGLFWDLMRVWSDHNYVLISELNAPDDFITVWEKPVSRSLNPTDKIMATEKLFTYKDGKYADYLSKIQTPIEV